jgi:hypothetical protein
MAQRSQRELARGPSLRLHILGLQLCVLPACGGLTGGSSDAASATDAATSGSDALDSAASDAEVSHRDACSCVGLGCGVDNGCGQVCTGSGCADGSASTGLVMYGLGGDAINITTWRWDGRAWTKLDVDAGSPGYEDGPQLVTLNGTAVLVGGVKAGEPPSPCTSYVWTWDGSSAWSCAADMGGGPGPRHSSGLAVLGDNVVLFGGFDQRGRLHGDTWTWNPRTGWQQMSAVGPTPRALGVMVALRDQVVLFGGRAAGEHDLEDTWLYDGHRWSELKVTGPSRREAASAAALGDVLVMFGGGTIFTGSATSIFLRDTWTFDGSHWTREEGDGPSARAEAAIAALNGALFLYGGDNGVMGGLPRDTWQWDGRKWIQLSVPGPGQQLAPVMTAYRTR